MAQASRDQPLFAYATLQSAEVQLETFGRRIDGDGDVLLGYTLDHVEIDDPRVALLAGEAVRPVLRPTGSALDKIVGTLLWITEDELDAADEYEMAVYRRVSVTLASGQTAWVYVGAGVAA